MKTALALIGLFACSACGDDTTVGDLAGVTDAAVVVDQATADLNIVGNGGTCYSGIAIVGTCMTGFKCCLMVCVDLGCMDVPGSCIPEAMTTGRTCLANPGP